MIMKNTDKKTIKKWIDVWNRAGESLQEQRKKELQAEDYYQKNLPLLNEMLWYSYENRTVRLTSGLVEQQRLFMNFHKKLQQKKV